MATDTKTLEPETATIDANSVIPAPGKLCPKERDKTGAYISGLTANQPSAAELARDIVMGLRELPNIKGFSKRTPEILITDRICGCYLIEFYRDVCGNSLQKLAILTVCRALKLWEFQDTSLELMHLLYHPSRDRRQAESIPFEGRSSDSLLSQIRDDRISDFLRPARAVVGVLSDGKIASAGSDKPKEAFDPDADTSIIEAKATVTKYMQVIGQEDSTAGAAIFRLNERVEEIIVGDEHARSAFCQHLMHLNFEANEIRGIQGFCGGESDPYWATNFAALLIAIRFEIEVFGETLTKESLLRIAVDESSSIEFDGDDGFRQVIAARYEYFNPEAKVEIS